MVLSKRTRAALAIFTAVATTVAFTGCDGSDREVSYDSESSSSSSQSSSAGTRLVDDNGNEYTLVKNADGTETAKYDDGKEVTFKRDDDGNLNLVSGAGGLLAGLAAGYFLFHGMSSPGGSYNGSRYVPSSRPSAISSYDRDKQLKKYMREDKKDGGKSGGGAAATTKSSSSTASSTPKSNVTSSSKSSSSASSSKSSSSSSKSSVSSSAKGGFGSAGARSGGAS